MKTTTTPALQTPRRVRSLTLVSGQQMDGFEPTYLGRTLTTLSAEGKGFCLKRAGLIGLKTAFDQTTQWLAASVYGKFGEYGRISNSRR